MAYVVDCDRLDGKERLQSYGGNLRSLCSGGTARLQAHTNEVREACLGANGSFLRAVRVSALKIEAHQGGPFVALV
jgi:hypothetical protein